MLSSDKKKPTTTVRSLINAVKQVQTDNANKLIARPPTNESIKKKEEDKQEILSTVKKLLEVSSGEDHVQKVASVLGYLGEIVIDPSTFISKKDIVPLNEYMNLKSNEQSTEEKPSQTFPFSRDEANQFVDLYKKIANYYNQIKSANCKWFFSYPLSDDGQIQRSGIQEWQHTLTTEESKSSTQSFVDFKRDFEINGKSLRDQSDKVITKAIEELVDKSKGYDAKNKKELKSWLKANGGQEINRFIDLLIAMDNDIYSNDPKIKYNIAKALASKSEMDNDLSNDPEIKYNIAKILASKSNWFNASNDQIQFEYTMNILSMIVISETGAGFLFRDEDDVVRLEEEPPEGLRAKTLLPLMTVDSRVELEVSNGKVIPKVVQLEMVSYAGDYLTSPAKKLEGPSEEQKSSFTPRT